MIKGVLLRWLDCSTALSPHRMAYLHVLREIKKSGTIHVDDESHIQSIQ